VTLDSGSAIGTRY